MRKHLLLTAAFLPLLAFANDFTYHETKATVVAVNPPASTVVVKWADGSTSLSRVEGNAVIKLGSLKAGDRIMATCQKNIRGQHMAITAIKIRPRSVQAATTAS